jgi:hypothetical protein
VFSDLNYPEVFYYGDIRHMRGLEIEGGYPQRCYVGEWVNGLWQDHYADKRPGDSIEVTIKMGEETHKENWDVLKAPDHWADLCEQESLDRDTDCFDTSMDTLDVYMLETGDCIFDKIQIEDEKYPLMKWGIVKLHSRDADLLYMVPLLESDPYGNITDPDHPYLKDNLWHGVFVEDTEAQDHLVAYTGHGVWIHRIDLLGVDRDTTRSQIVEPCRKSLSDMVSGFISDTGKGSRRKQ